MSTERSPITIETDARNLRLVKTNYPDIDLTNPDNLINAMKSKYKPRSIKTYLISIYNDFKAKNNTHVADLYRKRFTEYAVEIGKVERKQELSDVEKDKFVDWDTIVKAYNEIQADTKITDESKLLASFYVRLPPARVDYAKLKIYKEKPKEDKGNYIVLDKHAPFVKINEHKTSKTYGDLQHPLPAELLTEINAYLSKNPELTTLFDMSELTMSKRIIATFLKKTGKRIGVNILRHAFITKFKEGEKPLLDKMDLAKKMGHSTSMQDLYRRLVPAGGAGST